MMRHETDKCCPFCGEVAALTTETGWIDATTITAVLCCPSCRIDSAHAEDACQIAHLAIGDRNPDAVEQEAIERVISAGLPA